jgi:hypothetical protein
VPAGGVQAVLVAVHAGVAGTAGPPPAAAVWTEQARDRVRAAILNSGLRWPDEPVQVGVQPPVAAAGGGWADLAAALAVLAADGQVPAQPLDALVVLGELGLDGAVRPVRGALPCAVAAADAGMRRLLVAQANAAEAALAATGVQRVVGVGSLAAAVAWLRGEPATVTTPAGAAGAVVGGGAAATDLAEAGWLHPAGRRAVDIAAAGGHHLRLTGPPDSGTRMLAQLLAGLLPPLTHSAAPHRVPAERAGPRPGDQRPLVTAASGPPRSRPGSGPRPGQPPRPPPDPAGRLDHRRPRRPPHPHRRRRRRSGRDAHPDPGRQRDGPRPPGEAGHRQSIAADRPPIPGKDLTRPGWGAGQPCQDSTTRPGPAAMNPARPRRVGHAPLRSVAARSHPPG